VGGRGDDILERQVKIPDLSTALELPIGTADVARKELGHQKVYERFGFPPEREYLSSCHEVKNAALCSRITSKKNKNSSVK
jgi:hypothetical protein